jgi:hypothetical protein
MPLNVMLADSARHVRALSNDMPSYGSSSDISQAIQLSKAIQTTPLNFNSVGWAHFLWAHPIMGGLLIGPRRVLTKNTTPTTMQMADKAIPTQTVLGGRG